MLLLEHRLETPGFTRRVRGEGGECVSSRARGRVWRHTIPLSIRLECRKTRCSTSHMCVLSVKWSHTHTHKHTRSLRPLSNIDIDGSGRRRRPLTWMPAPAQRLVENSASKIAAATLLASKEITNSGRTNTHTHKCDTAGDGRQGTGGSWELPAAVYVLELSELVFRDAVWGGLGAQKYNTINFLHPSRILTVARAHKMFSVASGKMAKQTVSCASTRFLCCVLCVRSCWRFGNSALQHARNTHTHTHNCRLVRIGKVRTDDASLRRIKFKNICLGFPLSVDASARPRVRAGVCVPCMRACVCVVDAVNLL